MRQLLLFTIALFLSTQNIVAQTMIITHVDETELQFKVKQIDEFFQRFNYDIDYKWERPQEKNNFTLRKKNMQTLFNYDVFSSQEKKIEINDFIDYVIDNQIRISYEDSTWYAMAYADAVYNGKKCELQIKLKTERIKDVYYKWVIADVNSPIFSLLQEGPKDSISISPAEHGVSFISLPEFFDLNKANIRALYANGYKSSNLPVFEFLLRNKMLKINMVRSVKYYFELPYAHFCVERIEKEKSYNQGWLINSLKFHEQ